MKKFSNLSMLISDLKVMLDAKNVQQQDRQEVLALAFAKILAYNCDLPSSEVNNHRRYFLEKFEQDCNQIIAQFNEKFVVDVTLIRETAYRLWSLRYNLVYQPESVDLNTLVRLPIFGKLTPKMESEKLVNVATSISSLLGQSFISKVD